MANQDQLSILLQGVVIWNLWRKDQQKNNKPFQIDPPQADLSNANLFNKNFSEIDLYKANLVKANLANTNFYRATLYGANLSGANLDEADLTAAILYAADLSEAKIRRTDIHGTVLSNANLHKADLSHANLTNADLSGADLTEANLTGANLSRANLANANLSHAIMSRTILHKTDLRGVNLSNSNVIDIIFDRWSRYKGARVDSCYGSQFFKRYAQDQAFIEELRSKSKLHFLIYLTWLILSDCGKSIFLWATWILALTTLFAYRFYTLGEFSFHRSTEILWNFDTTFYYSVVTLSTLGFGDITPITSNAKHWVMAEVIVGYIMLGGLISIFSNKLARRS